MANNKNDSRKYIGQGIYSNTAIKQAIKDGHIICQPFIKKHVNGSSLDLTLGEYFYTINDKRTIPKIYNPFDKEHVIQKFEGPHQASSHKIMAKKLGFTPLKNIPLNHPVIVLEPGERILAHTHEFVGIYPPGTSSMHSRSTMGRNGVVTCHDAGWGDPGYINRWTMEIQNIDEHQSIILPVGERVTQLVFHFTPDVDGEYSHLSGKYQTNKAKEVDKIIEYWEPKSMLPRAYKDKRTLPKKINK